MYMSKHDFTFEGFEPANTTPVPDVLFDVLLPKLSGAELKVLLYIIRRTWGFKKATDAISLSQFTDGITTKNGKVLDQGCGIKNRTIVSSALATLEKMGCIERTGVDDPFGDKAPTRFSIHFRGSIEIVPPDIEIVPPVVSKSYYGSIEIVPPVVSKRYPQETVIQETDSQETVIQESTFCANAPTRTVHFKAALSAKSQFKAEVIPFAEAGKRITDARLPAIKPSKQTTSSRPGSQDGAALADPPAGASSTSSDGPRASGRSQAPLSDTKEIQRRINEHRGYALEEKVEIIRERQAIKSWCSLHTAEEYEQVMQRLRTDPYWGKDENYSRIGGVNLAKETPKALASLKRNGTGPPEQEEVDEDYSDFDRYVGNGKEEREALYQEGLERQRNGTLIW